MAELEQSENLTGFVGTGAGSTWMELELAATRATLQFHSKWMGREPLDVRFALRHTILGSHSGALVVQTAHVLPEDRAVPLPPADGPLVLEYARVPPQRSPLAGSGVMAAVGEWTDPWTLLLWLHPDVMYDDGTQLPLDAYEVPPDQFAPVVDVLRELERPWKFG